MPTRFTAPPTIRRSPLLALLLMLLGVSTLTGCSSQYTFRGKVIPGGKPGIVLLDEDDPRLTRPGLPYVNISGVVDPKSVDPTPLGPTRTNENGEFSIPIEKFWAGFLEYPVNITFRRPGNRPVRTSMVLPSQSKVLLVTMATGADDIPPRDVVEESLRAGEAFDR